MLSELIQNPKSPAPDAILKEQVVLLVDYIDFSGASNTGNIVIHKFVERDVKDFFTRAFKLKFPIEKIVPISMYNWDDEKSCENNNSSGFNYRKIGGSDFISKHSLGCAFDINPKQNVYTRYDKTGEEVYRLPKDSFYKPNAKGALSSEHELVLLMKERGWTWGGDWTPDTGRVDYQHFEIVPKGLEHFLN